MLGFLYSDYKKNGEFLYRGELLNLTLDATEAMRFLKLHPPALRKEFEIPNLYGKPHTFHFPVDPEISAASSPADVDGLLSVRGYKDITKQWYKRVVQLAALSLVTDYTLGAHKQLTHNFRIFFSEEFKTYHLEPLPTDSSNSSHLYGSASTTNQKALSMAVEMANSGMSAEGRHALSSSTDSSSNLPPLPTVGDYMILKEWIMNVHRPEPLTFYSRKGAEPQHFKVGQDYTFSLPAPLAKTNNIPATTTVTVPDNYTAALRYQLFNRALSQWNADPKNRLHQRNTLLQSWQTDAKLRMARKTVLIVPRRCVHEDTPVKLEDGSYIPAKEVTIENKLWDNKKIISIQHQLAPSYKLHFDNGTSIIVSENHRILRPENYHHKTGWDLNEDNYITAKDLKEGEFVPAFCRTPGKVDTTTKDFADGLLYGSRTSDGDRHNHLITCPNKNIHTYIMDTISPYYQSWMRKDSKTKKDYYIVIKNVTINTGTGYPEHNEYSYNRYIDHKLFAKSDNFKWGALAGLILGDGYIYAHGKPSSKDGYNRIGKGEISYNTTSKRLANDIFLLCGELGISSYIREKKVPINNNYNSTTGVSYNVIITDKDSLKHLVEHIGESIKYKKNYDKLIEIINTNTTTNNNLNIIPKIAREQITVKFKCEHRENGNRKSLYNGVEKPSYNFQRRKAKHFEIDGWLKYFWTKVTKIEKLEEEQPVVNIEVDGDHTLICAGMPQHNSGKTLFMAEEIMLEMLNHNYRAATRPRTILFISKDYDAVNQVMDYVLSLIEEFDWMKKMFYYDKTEHIFYLRTLDPVSGKYKILAQCKFYSALGNLPGVGDAADAVFFDEAMYVPTSVKDGIMKIVDHEGARLLVVSTFYDEAPGTNLYYWPVNLCNKFEAESSQIVDPIQHIIELYYKHRHNTTDTTYTIPDEVAGLRYTIDDIEVITDKDGAKAALQDNPESFMRQLYCRYLEKEGVFNYKASIVPSKFVPPSSDPQFPQPHYLIGLGDMQRKYIPQRTRIVTAYDPALTSDMSAWLDSAYDEKRNKIIIFKELQLNLKNKASFIPQAHLIKDHVTTYLEGFKVPILKSMDASHPAVSDAMAGQGVHFQYYFRRIGGDSASPIKDQNKPNTWKVPKRLMVEATQLLFDNNMIEIWEEQCPMLIEQLGTYEEYKTQNGRSKWEASLSSSKNKDDFVSTLLMVCWTWWNHLGLSRNKLVSNDIVEPTPTTSDPNSPFPFNSHNPYANIPQSQLPPRMIQNPMLEKPRKSPEYTYDNVDIGFIY